jgi:hypothetical protein
MLSLEAEMVAYRWEMQLLADNAESQAGPSGADDELARNWPAEVELAEQAQLDLFARRTKAEMELRTARVNAGLLASEPIEVEDAIAVMPREAQAPSPEAPPNAFELEDEADAAARKWALELEQDMEEERRAAQVEKVSAEEAVQKRSFLRRSWGWLTRQGVPDPKRWAAEKAQAEREQAENEKAKVVTAPKDDASWFGAGKSLSQSSSEDFQSLSPISVGVASDAPTPKPFGLTPVEVIMDMRRKAAEEQAENEKLEGEGEVEAVKKRPV